MAIKIIRKASDTFRIECGWCNAIFEYNYEDIDHNDNTVFCPCCKSWCLHSEHLKEPVDLRATGKWVKTNSELAEMTCSNCGFQYYGEHDIECMSNYCPDCGAKMEKEVKSNV